MKDVTDVYMNALIFSEKLLSKTVTNLVGHEFPKNPPPPMKADDDDDDV